MSTVAVVGGGSLLALGIGLEIWGPRGSRSTAHVAVSNDGTRLSLGGSF